MKFYAFSVIREAHKNAHDFSFVYHGSVLRNNDMEGDREIGVVVDGRITTGSLCFTYTPVSTV